MSELFFPHESHSISGAYNKIDQRVIVHKKSVFITF